MTNIKNILNNAVSLIVVMIVLLLIIPISPFFLDVMIILNISVGLIVLLISMNIKEALEFSIFPSLLLITTLYRIGINVSTTRSILSNGGSAGSVIGAMGNFVLQGNAVVGVVIFLLVDQPTSQIGIDRHLLTGHRIQGKSCRNLRHTLRTLGNYNKLH